MLPLPITSTPSLGQRGQRPHPASSKHLPVTSRAGTPAAAPARRPPARQSAAGSRCRGPGRHRAARCTGRLGGLQQRGLHLLAPGRVRPGRRSAAAYSGCRKAREVVHCGVLCRGQQHRLTRERVAPRSARIARVAGPRPASTAGPSRCPEGAGLAPGSSAVMGEPCEMNSGGVKAVVMRACSCVDRPLEQACADADDYSSACLCTAIRSRLSCGRVQPP